MKLILSRKGFDSSIGRVPSPIFPSGAMYSLPIPEGLAAKHCMSYAEVQHEGRPLSELVAQLTNARIGPAHLVHLDPDLRAESRERDPGWKPLFGQAEAAEGHLQSQGVEAGDIFLFFGWFRRVERVGAQYSYVKDAPDQHVIFGWFQIERRIPVTQRAALPAWALYHPHCQGRSYGRTDSLYIATDRLKLAGRNLDRPGAGVFRCYNEKLCLTAPGARRSLWRLPGWFDPRGGRPPLTYHRNLNRWQTADDHVHLDSAKRGQEFVLDCDKYPEAIAWLAALLRLAE
jgi:Nucleotide modification associated domain 3